jgi:hypothetical protein
MWQRLERWHKNLEIGMTKDKYLSMCEQLGEDPSDSKCPPEYDDFPVPLQQAIEVFNRLGDRVAADIGYLGKDYTALSVYIEVVAVTEKEIFLEALVRLDAHLIKRSAEQMKKARDSVKKK